VTGADLDGAVRALWTRVLGIDALDPDDDFFELGGHSLLALALTRQVRRELGLPMQLRDVFAHRTLHAQVTFLGRQESPRTAAGMFTERVRTAAESVAVVDGEHRTTYGELHARATRLSASLRAAGVADGDLVVVLLPRGADLIAALIGTMLAGAAYAAIDPATPDARIRDLLAAVPARTFVTGAGHDRLCASYGSVVRADRVPPGAARPARAVPAAATAYVVFTSGSTGRPKAVAVSNHALSAHLAAIRRRYALTAADRVLQFASPGFDVLAEEVFPTLATGGQVVVAEPGHVPGTLERHLDRHGVTVVNLPTPLWTVWTRDLQERPRPLPATLRLVVIGSEVGHPDALARWLARPRPPVINAYGLSEATVTSTAGALTAADAAGDLAALPAGPPIDGTRLYVLDDDLRPVPPGTVGELFVAGDGVATGYLGQPAATAERFLPDPWAPLPGARMLRTGDLARIRDDRLHLVGRRDRQVKIRGHRVEPVEVQAALAAHPDVGGVWVAVAHPDGRDEGRLAAFVVPRDVRQTPTAAALRAHVARRLPTACVPASFTVLAALPTLPNGKIDEAALPAPRPGVRREPPAPARTGLQAALQAIWQDTLGVERVGVDDDLFDLGGSSLTATLLAAAVDARLGRTVTVAGIFAARTVAGVAELLERAGDQADALGRPVAHGEDAAEGLALSRQQQQMLFIDTLTPGSAAYHAQTTIRVLGPLDLGTLNRALTEMSRRHAVLRTTFVHRPSGWCQVVHPPTTVHADHHDLRGCSSPERPRRRDALIADEVVRRFDVGRLPLLRWTVITMSDAEHELVLVEHHLVHDGWSFALLMRELTTLYTAYERGLPSPLPEPRLQYFDYGAWQDAALAGMDRHRAFWRTALADLPAPLSLPGDRPRPRVQTDAGAALRLDLPPAVPQALRAFCRAERVTLFAAMLAVFQVLLHRYTGEHDIAIGSAFANRQVPGTGEVVGMFVNQVLLRAEVRPARTLRDLAGQAQRTVAAAAAHQELPFTEVVRELRPDRDGSGSPLTRILFSANDTPVPELVLGAATGTIFERTNGTAKMDLDITVLPRREAQTASRSHLDDRITLLWEYNTELYDDATMRDLSGRYLRLLAAAVAAPDTPIGELPLVDDDEIEISAAPAGTAGARPTPEIAAGRPDRVAVQCVDHTLTYGRLDERARALAAHLTDVSAGPVVGILLPRGPGLVVAEVAVLACGRAFLPLDPDTPPARIAFCCVDAGVDVVVTDATLAARVPAGVRPVTDVPAGRDAGVTARPGDPAYVIYTSGSTGEPKGVVVPRGALTHMTDWYCRDFGLHPGDRIAMASSPAFDGSVGEIFTALRAGATLVVPDDPTRIVPARMADWLVEQRITFAELPVTPAEAVIGREHPGSSLRLLVSSGEQLHARPSNGTPYTVVNAYGPTETTNIVTTDLVRPDEPGLPTIGRPVAGVSAYVLDERGHPVPPGGIGELYIGGVSLAHGYVRRPDLTAQAFVPHPYASTPGQRLYRTGDRVRRRRDGRLDHLGRFDAQLKIRGYRVEPGEVVAALSRHPAVSAAHVTVPRADRRLIAYLVAADVEVPGTAVRAFLRERLPAHLVPEVIEWVDRLPLNRNGKVDTARLPAPRRPPAAPRPRLTTDLQRRLLAAWRDTLGLDDVGLDDDFFDLGGHSLALGRLYQHVVTHIAPGLPLITLYEHPTVERLARAIEHRPGREDR
jgi:amino acid adenylation domain-containing protein